MSDLREAFRTFVDVDGNEVHYKALATYTYEGEDVLVWFIPDVGAFARLSDLCRVHICGSPESINPLFENDGMGGVVCDRDQPAATLVNLDDEEMEIIRSRSPSWAVCVRFRDWVLATVLPDSPYFQTEIQRWDRARSMAAEAGLSPRPGAPATKAEDRASRWAEEQKNRPKV
jgi:hypothetical protein